MDWGREAGWPYSKNIQILFGEQMLHIQQHNKLLLWKRNSLALYNDAASVPNQQMPKEYEN